MVRPDHEMTKQHNRWTGLRQVCNRSGLHRAANDIVQIEVGIFSTFLVRCSGGVEPGSTKVYWSGMKRDELVDPRPGRPWRTGLYVMENSPK